jgi:alpha-tubulin suppressor-like RCC1 family protein
VQKVWNKPGSFTGSLSATVNGTSLSASQTAVVVGRPIAAADSQTCALKPDIGVFCWGNNFGGQLGDGTIGNIKTTTVVVTGLSEVVSMVRVNPTLAHSRKTAAWFAGAS